MPKLASNEHEPAPRWLLTASVIASLLLHVGVGLVMMFALRAPELDVEFELPMDVELGTTDELAQAPTLPSADEAAAAGGGAAASGSTGLDGGLADAAVDAAVDAGAADGGKRARSRDAGPPAVSTVADGGAPGRLPPGTQIALRVDMARIRKSPIAEDVRRLLASVPDWQALLDGSGIDPVEQLDRMLIATPNLQREKIVVAGRYLGAEQVVLDAVERLARERGASATWREEGSVRVAPWANRDATARVIALVGPSHFTISREQDLARVLAIAHARAERHRGQPLVHPADALLSMQQDEGLSLEIEGASQFVRRGRRGVPERLRVSALDRAGGRISLHGQLTYADEAAASDAERYLGELRDLFANNTLVMLLGLSGPLDDASLQRRGLDVEVKVELSTEQTRLVLGYVRELLTPPAPPAGPTPTVPPPGTPGAP